MDRTGLASNVGRGSVTLPGSLFACAREYWVNEEKSLAIGIGATAPIRLVGSASSSGTKTRSTRVGGRSLEAEAASRTKRLWRATPLVEDLPHRCGRMGGASTG